MSRFVPIVRFTWLVCWRNGLIRDLRHKITQLVQRNMFAWETRYLRDERIMQQWLFYEHSNWFREVPRQLMLGNHVEQWENGFYGLPAVTLVLHAVPLPRRHRRRQWPMQRLYWVWIDAPSDHPFNSERRKLP